MLSILQEHFIIITPSSATQIKASHTRYNSIFNEYFVTVTPSSAPQIKASHAIYSSIFDKYFVTVAPRPGFTGLGGNNDEVFCAMIVFGCVFIW